MWLLKAPPIQPAIHKSGGAENFVLLFFLNYCLMEDEWPALFSKWEKKHALKVLEIKNQEQISFTMAHE